MNVCLLSLEWPSYGGGIGTYMFNLAKGLQECGHNTTVITHNKQPERISGVNIVETPIENENRTLKNKIMRWRWEPHHSWSQKAWDNFKEMQRSFDILETAEYGAWARHFIGNVKMPIIVRCHTPAVGVRQIPVNGNEHRIPFWLKLENKREQMQTQNADAISTPSYVLSNLMSLSWSIPVNRIKVLPNPVDTNLFRPIDFKEKQKEILYVGRLQYNKGVFDFIDAIKPLLNVHQDWTIRLIGKDLKIPDFIKSSHKMASEEILSRIPVGNRNQIKIIGWVSVDELIKYQQQAMIAVVPSRGFESFSYTLTEQMACGTAVVATHCGGPTEIISDGYDGLLVPAGDIEAMRNALQKLMIDTELCREMSRRARKTVESKYSISKVVPAITEWYGKIIGYYKND
ncbi:MAG: hypothetical protein A2Y12_02875 [Planctomycetes bacterium GWF2_42_9]|nr:MAG: hypothetical protein A2Y12_02875 [Planctomycetes bacterium GWF2_42_9]